MSDLLPALPKAGAAVSAGQVAEWERRVIENVGAVSDIDHLMEWRAQAAALEAYLRAREMQGPMLGAERRIEGRVGQLLGEPEQGKRTDLGKPLVTHAGEVKRKDDRADFRLIGRALSGEPHPDTGKSFTPNNQEWWKSRRALVALIRQRLGLMPETPDLPNGQFACIVADPPWRLDTGPDVFGGTIERGHDALAYEQLSVETIAELGETEGKSVRELAAPDAHLYLWTTNKYLRDAYTIAESWGFKPSVVLTWCKRPRGVGLGDTFRLTTEFILFARRGHLPHAQIVPTTWFDWPRSTHSVKPAGFYELVESVTPGPYVDLFARTARNGWTVWGNEAPDEESA